MAREQQLEVIRTEARLEIANAPMNCNSRKRRRRSTASGCWSNPASWRTWPCWGTREGASAFLDVLDARRTLRAVNVEYYWAVVAQHSLAELEFAVGAVTWIPTKPPEVKDMKIRPHCHRGRHDAGDLAVGADARQAAASEPAGRRPPRNTQRTVW